MAKARAICTCAECGATFCRETIRRNRSSADDWEKWAAVNITVCPDCEAKAYAANAAEAAKRSQEDGLPALRGTEKQVAWAEQIRREKLAALNKYADECAGKGGPKAAANVTLTAEWIMREKTSARWWIDARTDSSHMLVQNNFASAKDAQAVQEVEAAEQMEEPALPASTVIHPEGERFGTANIVVTDARVEAYYPKDEDFRATVKSTGYSWDSATCCWVKIISPTTGSAVDRAAEIMNVLLGKGFSVDCKNAEACARAVSGEYAPECKRWIKYRESGQYAGWLAIVVPRRSEDDEQGLYDAARRIKGTKWDAGSVVVPVAQYALVEDFANIYGYRFTDAARAAIERQKEAVTVKPLAPEQPQQKDILGEILRTSADILPDLVDNETAD